MKPVQMSRYGLGNGDCLTACIASLLECGIDDVPNFSDFGTGWHSKTVKVLQGLGLETIYVKAETLSSLIVSGCQCIAIFETESEESHAKLGYWRSTFNGETWDYVIDEVFDPNRNGVRVGALQGVFLIFRTLK